MGEPGCFPFPKVGGHDEACTAPLVPFHPVDTDLWPVFGEKTRTVCVYSLGGYRESWFIEYILEETLECVSKNPKWPERASKHTLAW